MNKKPDESPTDFLAKNNLIPIVGVIMVAAFMFIRQAPWSSVDVTAALDQREKSDHDAAMGSEKSNHESEERQFEQLQDQMDKRFADATARIKAMESEVDTDQHEDEIKLDSLIGDVGALQGRISEIDIQIDRDLNNRRGR